ncbi:glycoside hydrolase family 32 protein [Actinomyces haliotis]|uniref:glycoside hydrolase family 32 protein n=1 Tax=Actinomyces haliotis TaxID=1280843 RepID=UPI00188F556F|nr:glycoside hydrolase family 32 protein [Actinomyces haliotis]
MTSSPSQAEAGCPLTPSTPGRRVEVPEALQRGRADADPARPRWHVTPPWGWLNDPNGLTVQPGPDGEPLVHLFYQHNSHAPVHDLIQWGHQYSADLVRWTDLPIALEPGPEGPDALGCWSGVIVDGPTDPTDPDGPTTPTMVYSGNMGGPTQVGCLAVPAVPPDEDPLLTRWVKDGANPVVDVAHVSVGQDLPEMRDHSVWREDGRWYQVMGSGIPGAGADGAQGGAALCFSSEDLRTWTYEGPLAVGDGDVSATGTVWECPELSTVPGDGGTADVLCVSAWHDGDTMRSMWMTGVRTGTRMTVTAQGCSDLGENYFYAPQSVTLPDGRRVTIGWMQLNGTQEQRIAAGWAGSMNVPRTVTLAADGTLRFAPIAEFETLRGDQVADLDGEAAAAVELRGRSLDVVLSGELGGDPVVIDLLASEDGSRRTRLMLSRRAPVGDAGQDAWTGWLSLDRTGSVEPGSPCEGEETRELSGPVPLGEDGGVELRILLDRSSLEVFVNGQPLSARVGSDPADERVVVHGAGLTRARLRAWTMDDAYGERLAAR